MRQAIAAVASSVVLFGSTAPPMSDKVADGQWFHTFLSTAEISTVSQGNGVIVAVVDSGVDDHPDLAGSVLPGYDLVGSSDGRTDTNGHGTAMAGLIAGHGRVAGIAPGARILPIRYKGSGLEGPVDQLALGVRWAVGQRAGVISISQSGVDDDLLLRQEIEAALRADIVVVAGVGNRPKQSAVGFPAAIPGVVAVAGVGKDGNRSSISVSGPEVVIAAPSDNISSTDKGGGYREGTGTSDATAIVAGAVALIRAKFPQMKATEVVRRLTATAVDKGAPGRDNDYGYGVLNIVGALTAELPAATTAPAKTSQTPTKPPTESRRFPWWLVAVPMGIVVLAGGWWLAQRRRRQG